MLQIYKNLTIPNNAQFSFVRKNRQFLQSIHSLIILCLKMAHMRLCSELQVLKSIIIYLNLSEPILRDFEFVEIE